MFSVPLPELGLQYVVDVHADSPDGPLVDLDLVEVGRAVRNLAR
jgi:hypothetical protein